MANIESFEKEWKEAIQSEIESRLKGKTPQTMGTAKTVVDPFIEGFKKAY